VTDDGGHIAERRGQAEAIARDTAAQFPENIDVLSPEEARRALHALRVYQIELEMQNDELRRAQVERDAARERYFDLYDQAPVGYVTLSEEGLILEANLTAASLLGVARSALIKRELTAFILFEDQDVYYLHCKQVFDTGASQVCEFRMRRADATVFWARVEAVVVHDTEGVPVCRAVMSDVTERKRAEEALREREQRYRALVATSMDAVLLTIPDGRVLAANEAACRMFGFPEEEVIALGRSAIVDDTDPRLIPALEERVRVGRVRCELTFKRKDGTRFPGEISSVVFSTPQGEPRTSTVIRDLTEQKKIENGLRESEERYRAVVEDQTETISRIREDGTLIFVNEVYCRFFGKTAEELLGKKWHPMAVPEDVPYIKAQLRTLSPANPVVVIENRVYSGSGQIHWMQFVNRGFFDAEGNLTDIQCVGRDISARKAMETALRESEELYRELFDKSADALMVFDAETLKIEDVNPKTQELYGYTRDELLSLTALDISAEPEQSRASMSDVAGGNAQTVLLRDHKKKDGTVFPVEISPGMFSVGGQMKIIGAVRDVSEQKWAEGALRRVSAYVRGLIEASVDALVTIGPDGKITDVNRSTEDLTGLSRAELIGTDFSIYFTQPERARAGYQRVFQEGRVQDYGLELRHRDGHVTPVHYNASVYRDPAGHAVGVFAAARDITERKRAEDALRAKQEELHALASELAQAEEQERRRIATYLHDEIGQLLAAVRVKFGAWKNRNPATNAPELLSDIERTIDKAINDTRLLTYELSPPILFELGLGPALEWIGEQVCEEHGLAFKFRDGGRTKAIPEELATALYRIARELLMNVAKHARAKQVSISVDLTSDTVKVLVEDDGIGMGASQYSVGALRASGHFGLLSIRERLSHFGGSLDFDSVPGQGTCAMVTAPLDRLDASKKRNLS